MAETLQEKLISEDFKPEVYVKYRTIESHGVEDLLSERDRIQKLAEETNVLLKKNVYKNYTQFIETAKEISYLEGEMYQLSHMLTEQQQVLTSLLDISIAGNSSSESGTLDNEVDEENNKNLSLLLEKVEGCATVLEVRGRTLLHSGELIELNTSDLKPIQAIYCVLLDDELIFATKADNARGPLQYRYQALYELDSLAIVNIKEDLNIKNVFKILMFPEARIFQCPSASCKKEWLSYIDQAKKKKLSSFKREPILVEAPNPFEDESDNPFDEDRPVRRDSEMEMPNWLLELPEELDVCIALREFERAVELIRRANTHCAAFPRSSPVKDTKLRVDNRVKQLVNILMEELKVSPDRSLQGGPRAARKAVSILVKLGKSSNACNLFLKRCSAVLKQNMKQQKAEGATIAYIEKLCCIFFSCISDTGHEFTRAFGNNTCASAFILWAKVQLEQFVQIFSKHVFTPQVSASVATECIACARCQCDQLPEIGLDLSFVLNDLLRSHIERLVTEMRDKLLEAIKLRANDDKWRPQNHQNITNIKKLIDDMKEIGIDTIESYIYDDCWLSLTANTTAFGKMYLNFLDDVLKLYTPTAHLLINEAITVTFQTHFSHVNVALQNATGSSDRQFIAKNTVFLSDILNLAEKRYLEKLGHSGTQITELKNDVNKLLTSSRTSFTKYSSTAYI